MHTMLIAAIMVFGCIMTSTFLYGSETTKEIAATEADTSMDASDDSTQVDTDETEDEEGEEEPTN